MREERTTLAAIRERAGAFVFFAEQWDAAAQRPHSFLEQPERSLADYLFARHALDRVVAVSFNANFQANLGDNPFTQPNYFQLARIPDESLDALGSLPHLEWLDFSETAITDEQIRRLSSLPNLKVLKAAACRNLTAGAMEGLERFPRLRSIDLTSTNFVWHKRAQSVSATQLVHLDLTRADLADSQLAALSSLETLKELDLDNTAVTNAGLRHLYSLKRLRRLNLEGTAVTRIGVYRLRKELPKLQVLTPYDEDE